MQPRSSAFTRAIGGIALAAGFTAAYFISPVIHSRTAAWVNAFSVRYYPPEIAEWSDTGWLITIGVAVFCATKGLAAAILSLITLRLATRDY